MPHSLPKTLLAAACAALFPALALAAAAPAADAERELQVLKDEAVQLGRELQAAERSAQFPGGSLASIYVSVRASGFLLDSISVRVNDVLSARHTYAGSESLALLKGGDGWHRLTRLRLEPGTYRLQAEFTGHFVEARAGDPLVTGQIEAQFEKGASELSLVLPIARKTRLDPPSLSEPLVPVLGADQAGSSDDPRYRTALYLKHDNRYLSALVELGDIARSAPKPDALPGAFHLLMAECYLGFGMEARAAALYQQIAAGAHDATTLARARLQLAQFEYQHGRAASASERLRAMREKLPPSLGSDWRLLVTNALLAQERYAEAAALLDREGIDHATPALRYNLAVALIRAGKVDEGRRQLDDVGTLDATGLEQLVLRDKANLTLGYQYLQEQQGRQARKVFSRIRTSGPFSNRALLGLGWAEIAQAAAPETAPDPTAAADSLGAMLRPSASPAAVRPTIEGVTAASGLPQAEQDALRRALVAWVELVKRDPMDPAVQEGMLAIPWALDRLQAYEQSLTHYLAAIATLERARTRMDQAMKSIRGGRMVRTIVQRDTDPERGWMWRLRDLPDVPETYFLQSLLAEHRFQEALKSYRDARLLSRQLDAWKERATEGGAAVARQRLETLRPRADAIAAAQDDLLETLSTRELQGQHTMIERYLTEARFAVARIYDRQQAGAP